MARDTELIALRNRRIRQVYDTMRALRTASGKPKHTVEYILEKISREHVYISVERIKAILYRSEG
jgi:hypothetical protein